MKVETKYGFNDIVEFGPKDDPVQGQIVRLTFAQTGATYEVVWWAGRDRKEAWLYESEIIRRVNAGEGVQ
jgi:hypothetical protein